MIRLQNLHSFRNARRYIPSVLSCRSTKFSSVTDDADNAIGSTMIYNWGIGSSGQLGHAKFGVHKDMMMQDKYVQILPRKLVRSKRFKSAAVGENCTLALTHEGELFGWGTGFVTTPEETSSKEPVPLTVEQSFVSVSAGPKHMAAIDTEGQVHTWGKGGGWGWFSGGGQLGHGGTADVEQPKLIAAFKEYGARAAAVSCGNQHTVILTDDGEVLTCGTGEYGLLGTGNSADATIPLPVEFFADMEISQVAAGFDHTLALSSEGNIYSWGKNNAGQLGHADSYIDIYSMEDFPRLIDADSIRSTENEEELKVEGHHDVSTLSFSFIAAGNCRSAAVTTDGSLYIWGSRLSHQPKLISRSLFGGKKVLKVACGGDQSNAVFAVLTEDNNLWTFGDSSSRMLGIEGVSGKQAEPLLVTSLENRVVDVACGFGFHLIAFVRIE